MNSEHEIQLDTNNYTLYKDGSILFKYGGYTKGDRFVPYNSQEEADEHIKRYDSIKLLPVIAEIDDFGKVLIYDKMWYRESRLDKCPVCGGEEELIIDCNGFNSRCKLCGQAINFGMVEGRY